MDNGYRSGSLSDAAPTRAQNVYIGTAGAEKPRDRRIVENQVLCVNRMIEGANGIMAHLDDLRGRLLGISEPNAPPNARDNEPKLVRAELPELSTLLERLEQQLGVMMNKLSDLQRI